MSQPSQQTGVRGGPVLVGFDGSERGRDAVVLGRLLAQMTNAPLRIATVRPESFPDGWLALSAEEVARVTNAEEAETERLTAEVNRLAPEAEIEVVRASSPARALYRLADAHGAGTVVVGSSHHAAIGRIAPGSVAERLLSGAPCAVAVAPAGYAERPEHKLHAIGVAYDASAEARWTLGAAEQLTARLHGALTVVAVAEPSPVAAPYGGGYEGSALDHAIREQVKAQLDEAVDRAPAMVAAKGHLRAGSAADELAQASRGLDLLVCGSRGYGPVRRVLLGSVTARLIRSAHCPVLVIGRGEAGPRELEGTTKTRLAAGAPRVDKDEPREVRRPPSAAPDDVPPTVSSWPVTSAPRGTTSTGHSAWSTSLAEVLPISTWRPRPYPRDPHTSGRRAHRAPSVGAPEPPVASPPTPMPAAARPTPG